ncbi:Hsp70 family protein [Rhodococcus sp. H36-A4]|uniref:Hsp70 family protein n=1 Tax=Rhodococcus sp. H36-A4 TaxID=3004353 RepID=UPI0022AF058E|nr:Hsp70 family protein [Rhodococcus sp. H36-A4]MCZ4076912.1 Hsp70 family protein [Rhodococcus sp. H36-A4]
MTVLLGVSMGAHAVRMAQPRNETANARVSSTRLLEAPQQLFFHNQVIDTIDDHVEYLAAESISALAAESEPSMTTGVAYRDAHQADTLHRALENQHLQNYRLVPEVEAVLEYLVVSGEAAGFSTVALFDLGSSGLNVSVVNLAARRVVVTQRSSAFSGDLIDEFLRDNQLARLGKPSDAADMDLFERRCRVAKERLSSNDAVCLPDESGMILLSRENFEALIADHIDQAIEFARSVLIDANVPIDAIVLIGGGSRIPLVRERVGPSLHLPAITPNEPETVSARGAALSARPTEYPQNVQPRTMPARPAPAAPVRTESDPAPAAGFVTPRPVETTPTAANARKNLPAADTGARPFHPPTAPAVAPTVAAPAVTAVPDAREVESASPAPKHFALEKVYWLDADYEEDDGEDEDVRRRRRIRAWSVFGVAAAAVLAVSGFFVTRTDAPAVVETAVTQPPATSVAGTSPPVAPPVIPAPLPPPPPVETVPEAPVVEPEPEVVEPTRQQVTEDQTTEQSSEPEVAPPPPPPPPLIPGLPDFTLPTLPPLFPPAP